MIQTNTNSIREYLNELKQTKSRHPEVLNELKNYWNSKLTIKLIKQ